MIRMLAAKKMRNNGKDDGAGEESKKEATITV